jgi:hypothetical protein
VKWLLAFAAVHGIQFSDDQCRVLRQVRIVAPECRGFANPRTATANFSARSQTPSAPGLAAGASAPGGPSRSPSGSSPGGSPSSPGSPGNPASGGSPGNPGGGASRPGEPSPPLLTPTPPTQPTRPTIDQATLEKLRGEIRDAARQRAIERIIHGVKPPDRPERPGLGDKPGLGMTLGPGGLRGASSTPTPSGGIRR